MNVPPLSENSPGEVYKNDLNKIENEQKYAERENDREDLTDVLSMKCK